MIVFHYLKQVFVKAHRFNCPVDVVVGAYSELKVTSMEESQLNGHFNLRSVGWIMADHNTSGVFPASLVVPLSFVRIATSAAHPVVVDQVL